MRKFISISKYQQNAFFSEEDIQKLSDHFADSLKEIWELNNGGREEATAYGPVFFDLIVLTNGHLNLCFKSKAYLDTKENVEKEMSNKHSIEYGVQLVRPLLDLGYQIDLFISPENKKMTVQYRSVLKDLQSPLIQLKKHRSNKLVKNSREDYSVYELNSNYLEATRRFEFIIDLEGKEATQELLKLFDKATFIRLIDETIKTRDLAVVDISKENN